MSKKFREQDIKKGTILNNINRDTGTVEVIDFDTDGDLILKSLEPEKALNMWVLINAHDVEHNGIDKSYIGCFSYPLVGVLNDFEIVQI